jgi:hypothetical protein
LDKKNTKKESALFFRMEAVIKLNTCMYVIHV